MLKWIIGVKFDLYYVNVLLIKGIFFYIDKLVLNCLLGCIIVNWIVIYGYIIVGSYIIVFILLINYL